MDYILQKELHERSLSLLELREKAVKRLRQAENDLYSYRGKSKNQKFLTWYTESDYEWRVKVCTRYLSFIEGVYERHMWKMRYTIPWKSGWMLPGKGIIGNLDLIPEIDYWVPKGTRVKGGYSGNVFVRDDQDISHPTMFLTPRLNEELQRRSKEMFEQQNTEKGLVEPVNVTYEETYSPNSIGYQ